MTIARTVSEVLSEHVTLEIEAIDRLYLNLYVPILQCPRGVGHFWIHHRGHRFASSSLMAPMTEAFVGTIERFAKAEGIDVVGRLNNLQHRLPSPTHKLGSSVKILGGLEA